MKHSKRYMVIFDVWSGITLTREKKEFDNTKEWKEYVELINSIYEDAAPSYDRLGYPKKWGYVVLDFKSEKILEWSSTKSISNALAGTNILILKDDFFRGEDEIPKDYQWDDGEYEGWLQYRWGDGKNAIDYEKNKKKKIRNIIKNEISDENEYAELVQDFHNKKITKEKMDIKMDKW